MIMATGEKHAVKREMDSLEECYKAAYIIMDQISEEFEHREENRIGVGCFILRKEEPS